MNRLKYILLILTLFLSSAASAQDSIVPFEFSDPSVEFEIGSEVRQDTATLQTLRFDSVLKSPLTLSLTPEQFDVRDNYAHSGLATYLGLAHPVTLSGEGRVEMRKLKDGPGITDEDWAGFKGRFRFLLISTETGEVSLADDQMTVSWPADVKPDLHILSGIQDAEVAPEDNLAPDIRRLKYAHLPRILRPICLAMEGVYETIARVTGLGWGVSLILFALLMKLVMFPVAMLTQRYQSEVSGHKAALEPVLDEIKKNHKGEVAHNKVMAAYKARGISPYFTLKPFLATAIGLPILIAIFNALGEIEPLDGASFLWIESLAHPDTVATLPFSLPFFGNGLNLLPFLMSGVTVLSTLMLKSDVATPRDLRKQKMNLYLMAAAFFVIFYTFPSGMVLYWTLATLFQLPLNRLMKSGA